MLQMGIIGLGNIAQKAYLPVYLIKQVQVSWHVFTREASRQADFQARYGFKQVYTDWTEFLNLPLDGVFIHTPTATHPDLIATFLARGVPVFVDKPVAESYAIVQELYQLAKQQNVFLMAGFNRRFAPLVNELKVIKEPNLIIVSKHRPNLTAKTHFALFDEMIHPLDTALYLHQAPLNDIAYKLIEDHGNLAQAIVTLHSERVTTLIMMNLFAGANSEKIEVMSPIGHYQVDNLVSKSRLSEQGELLTRLGDWEPISNRRGFTAMIEYFLTHFNSGYQAQSYQTNLTLLSHQVADNLAKLIK